MEDGPRCLSALPLSALGPSFRKKIKEPIPHLIDLHAHILPGIDDGPQSLEDSLEMARLAAADGITTIVATPHLFRRKSVDLSALNRPGDIRQAVDRFNEQLAEAEITLTVLPGCEVPLFPDIIKFIDEEQILTINDGHRYICLELPDSVRFACGFSKTGKCPSIFWSPRKIREVPATIRPEVYRYKALLSGSL